MGLTSSGIREIQTGLWGNGFVAAMGDGSDYDKTLESHLQATWPDYDIHLIDARSISDSGGGIHCVNNDQPAMGGESSHTYSQYIISK